VLYDETLVNPELRGLGQDLREQLAKDINSVQRILEVETLMAGDPWGLESIGLFKVYIAPQNRVQI
jgi:phosphoenolpyruvate carboxylase